MNRHSKRINPSHRREISIIKGYIRQTKSKFDGDGYPFKQAIKELRQEGLTIEYCRKSYMYYKI